MYRSMSAVSRRFIKANGKVLTFKEVESSGRSIHLMMNSIQDIQFDKPMFQHPFTCIIGGPTNSGKTVHMKRLIEHIDALVTPQIQEIIYCYALWQPEYVRIQQVNSRVKFEKGLPDFESFDVGVRRLIVIDDMISELNSQIETMFIRGSHHLDMSICLITQNIFSRVKSFRNLSLNAHYLVCFKQPRDASQIMHLAKQFCPRNTKYVIDAFYKATQEPFGYLLFDFRQTTPEILRLRTKIFPGENLVVYIPKQ